MSDTSNQDQIASSVDPRFNSLGSLPDLYDVGYSISIGFLVLASALVLFMQLGRTLIEIGVSKSKIGYFTIYKNMLCFAVCALVFWLMGFGTAFSEEKGANSFIGVGGIMLLKIKRTFMFFVQLSYALSANFIWSSSLSGRMKLGGYLYFSSLLSAFVYPIATHWSWDPLGWLARWGPVGAIDFGGASVVHVFAGSASLALIKLVGPSWNFDSNITPAYTLVSSCKYMYSVPRNTMRAGFSIRINCISPPILIFFLPFESFFSNLSFRILRSFALFLLSKVLSIFALLRIPSHSPSFRLFFF